MSTFASLAQFFPEELILGSMKVSYSDNEGIDAGGIHRDLYLKVSEEIFNEDFGNYFYY